MWNNIIGVTIGCALSIFVLGVPPFFAVIMGIVLAFFITQIFD